jgi:hypothetical protein
MTDPYDLDYPGVLNLIARHDGGDGHCDLHPEFRIDVDGCAYCHRIRSHRNAQLAVRAIDREREALGAASRPHRCDERCVCPTDGKPLYYAPASGQHACQDPECQYDDSEPRTPRIRSSFTEVPIAPGQRWTGTRGRQYEEDTLTVEPESPFRSFGPVTLNFGDTEIPVTDIRFDSTPEPRSSLIGAGELPKVKFSLLAGAGFTDLQAHVIRETAAHEQRYLALRFEGLDDAAARAELDAFTKFAQSNPWPTSMAWSEWQILRATKALKAMAPFTVDRPSLFGHRADAAMGRAFATWPTAPCACHPAPNPAARDYRRRTKHRKRSKR